MVAQPSAALVMAAAAIAALAALPSCSADTAAAEWLAAANENACGTVCGNVNTTDPSVKFMGSMKNVADCSATCEATGANCSIWFDHLRVHVRGRAFCTADVCQPICLASLLSDRYLTDVWLMSD